MGSLLTDPPITIVVTSCCLLWFLFSLLWNQYKRHRMTQKSACERMRIRVTSLMDSQRTSYLWSALKVDQVNRMGAVTCGEIVEECQKATAFNKPPRTQTSLDASTHSPCHPHHGGQAVPRLPELVCGDFLNRQLQVTSESTTSKSVNHVFISSGGQRLLLYVRPDRGVDYLYTSLKIRQCPVSRIAWMPTGAPSSLTLFDPTPFTVRMSMVLARKCNF